MLSKDTRRNLSELLVSRNKHVLLLDSNDYPDPFGAFSWVMMAGSEEVEGPDDDGNDPFDALRDFLNKNEIPVIPGCFSYDLKNRIESLGSANPDKTGFPLTGFFKPTVIIGEDRNGQPFLYGETDALIKEASLFREPEGRFPDVKLNPELSRDTYREIFGKIRKHLLRGDIYEINYCLHFSAIVKEMNPLELFSRLNKNNPAPFACFFKYDGKYLICSSPERFLHRNGEQVISQPIKGTARRTGNPETDRKAAEALRLDPKEVSENIMIADIVRNDLSFYASPGSVKVTELCGIYPFPTVFQMVTTIEARVDQAVHSTDIIRKAFPMGSMTGAPKIRAMELAEELETFRRGIYSGAVGYFLTDGSFDFNVVIRSFTWNSENGYLSLSTGSAVTEKATADQEYDECQLKAEALIRSLEVS